MEEMTKFLEPISEALIHQRGGGGGGGRGKTHLEIKAEPDMVAYTVIPTFE
jgi:hypothetical protein